MRCMITYVSAPSALPTRRGASCGRGSTAPSAPTPHYHLTDVQFSTVAMIGVGANPVLHERVRYRPYGGARHSFPSDFNEDGVTDAATYRLRGCPCPCDRGRRVACRGCKAAS